MKDLSIVDLPLLKEKFVNFPDQSSASDAVNIILFQQKHKYRIHRDHDYILGESYNKQQYLLPLSQKGFAICLESKAFQARNTHIFPIPQAWLSIIEDNSLYETYYSESSSDYLYDRDKILAAKGKNYRPLRNATNRIHRDNNLEFLPLSNESLHLFKQVLLRWAAEFDKDKDTTDYYECLTAIEEYQRLDLQGEVFIEQKEPIAFWIGHLGRTSFMVDFLKVSSTVPFASNYALYRIAQHSPLKTINYMQDLGSSSLRQFKRSQGEFTLLHKYGLSFKDHIL